ncbi:tubulin beta-1 chain-like [Dioscorea cayenensis subsp. rotundata]|uniref:Tubulin beta-1 chain-like n=1 Tax=Dioscorea cayennensis subsp. rotundata TaxID=55577 RepID=A0AB40B0M2_DIOCR|nr:tubulin beta-1 chain-like [Dioscorea cayenensis subsp. rotundata]
MVLDNEGFEQHLFRTLGVHHTKPWGLNHLTSTTVSRSDMLHEIPKASNSDLQLAVNDPFSPPSLLHDRLPPVDIRGSESDASASLSSLSRMWDAKNMISRHAILGHVRCLDSLCQGPWRDECQK